MKVFKILTFLLIIPFVKLSAQFSLETFLNEPCDNSIESIKVKLADKNLEEKEVKNYKALMYYDWLEPISIKVGYLFSKDGRQNGKVISNGKDDEGDAQKLFDISKFVLIKMYGNDFSETSMFGITMISWKVIEGRSVMLTIKGSKTMLTIMKI
jgi:hypothetical protein